MRLFLLIFTLLITLCSCTATKVVYNYADWGLQWKVQRMVPLSTVQKKQTRDAIQKLHAWHRSTQLNEYAEFLGQIQQDLKQTAVTADYLHAQSDKIQELLDASVSRGIPEAAPIIASLTDEQVRELMLNTAEERDQYKQDYVDISKAKQIEKRRKELTSYLMDWLGKLNDAQKAGVKKWSENIEPYESISLQQQLIWEQKLAAILANRKDQQALIKDLTGIMLYRTDDWLPELEAILDRNQARTFAFLAELLNQLEPSQQQFLTEKLTDYQQILRELAASN